MPLTFSAGSSTVCSYLRVASDVFGLSFVPVSPAFRPFTPVSPAIMSFLPASLPVLRSYNVPTIDAEGEFSQIACQKRGALRYVLVQSSHVCASATFGAVFACSSTIRAQGTQGFRGIWTRMWHTPYDSPTESPSTMEEVVKRLGGTMHALRSMGAMKGRE
jgi:hypothetical protein